MKSIYDISVTKIDGRKLDWAHFKGKTTLIVNVASECGYTPQYQQLQELYEYANEKLQILAVPCNDFGEQEPGNADEIKSFCAVNYGITFPLTQKMKIKSNPHELYHWLQNKSENGVLDDAVKWNFHKFIIDKNGKLIASFPSAVTPLDEAIMQHI